MFHVELVPGDEVEVTVAAKGGGSENKSKFVMLNPSDSIVDWVLKTVPTMGAGWCPPGMLGIGVGGTAEKAMLLAKESLMEPLDMHELLARGPRDKADELRIELYEKVNALGIGAQGLGGLTTVLDVKIKLFPTHAASKPVAMIPNCAATRHAHFVLDGSGPAVLEPPSLEQWPKVTWTAGGSSKRVNLDTLTRAEVASWKPGETLLLNGKMLTGRDAAHKRIADLFASGQGLPPGVDFTNRAIYYVGPVDPVRDEVVGPAGPTTATRMDKFTDMMLEKTGLLVDDRQVRARPGRDRIDQEAQGGLPDGRRRRGVPGVEGDPRGARGRVRGTGHGSDLRVRREGHAGHRRGRRAGHVGAQHRAGRMVGEDPHVEDPGSRGLIARWRKSTRCVGSSSSGIRSAGSSCISGRRGKP